LTAARAGPATRGARTARAPRTGPTPSRGPAGASTATAARIPRRRRGRAVRGVVAHSSGSGDGVGHAVRGSAQRRGAITAAGRRRFRSTSVAGARQRLEGTGGAGRCGVLHRTIGLSAPRTATGVGDARVFRGAAWPHPRVAGHRGRTAVAVPAAPRPVRRNAGASAPTAPHLRHRTGLCGNRSDGVTGVDGARVSRDHRRIRASVGRAARRRIRRGPRQPRRDTTMTTPALAMVDPLADPDTVLADYLEYVAALGLSGRSVRARTLIATTFLTSHPDLRDWMTRPAAERLIELRRTGAWPLLCHLIGRGELRLDLELAAVKNLTGLGRAVEDRDPDGFAAVRAAGLALGWTPQWIETVLGECLAVPLAWHGGLVSGVSADTVDEFDAALAATQSIPATSRRAYRNRIAGLRQMLFQARIVDTPPRRRRWARSYAQRFAEVPMADAIRAT